MADVIRILRREHAQIAALVKILEREIDEFEKGGQPDYDVVRGALDYFMGFPDMYHHPKEDLVFARLAERDPGACDRTGDLRAAHEELAARSREFAAGIRAVLEEAQVPRESLVKWARAFTDLQTRHMQMEETIFFPAALAALTPDDWVELEAVMTNQEDPLFGDNVGRPLEDLRETVLRWHRELRG
jgi:hemerythrin-like domain-containing protein